ncbi:hypothetical protein C8Q79DRAFT_135305 [Trametes meyenii]|nr:hypothetical protein C8Q79DRAFT_135305 [Trametes meyenii]
MAYRCSNCPETFHGYHLTRLDLPCGLVKRKPLPKLPIELIDIIVDLLSSDWRDLVNFATVYPRWAPQTFKYLSSPGITLSVDPGRGSPDIEFFIHSFTPPSNILDATLHLIIAGSQPPPPPSPLPHPSARNIVQLPLTLRSFAHLPRLRSLVLRAFLVPDAITFLRLLSSCLFLEELYIKAVGLRYGDRASAASMEEACAVAQQLPLFPRLKTLFIADHWITFSPVLLNAFAVGMQAMVPAAPIRSLSLHLHHSYTCRGLYSLPLHGWHDALLSIRATLEELDVSVPIPLDRFPEFPHRARFPTVIPRCISLRHLTIRYVPGSPTSCLYFLDSVCALLSARWTAPLHALQTFTLSLPIATLYDPSEPLGFQAILTAIVSIFRALSNIHDPAMTDICITLRARARPLYRAGPLPEGEQDNRLEGFVTALQSLSKSHANARIILVGADEWS